MEPCHKGYFEYFLASSLETRKTLDVSTRLNMTLYGLNGQCNAHLVENLTKYLIMLSGNLANFFMGFSVLYHFLSFM